MKLVVAAILLSLLCACGGGSSTPSAPLAPGRPVLFGYYGAVNSTLPEVSGHATLAWVMGWNGTGSWLDNASAQLAQARQLGFRSIVLGLPQAYDANAPEALREALSVLSAQGLLDGITAVYPIDEPDLNGKSDAEVTRANAAVRAAMAEFPQLALTKIAVIYSAGGQRPGVASYDWIGFDDYDSGCAALSGAYEDMKRRLRADQQILVVPGGADPWRQDPSCFVARAQQDPQVVAVVAFLWFDDSSDITRAGSGPAGIRSNGMAQAYLEAGRIARGAP